MFSIYKIFQIKMAKNFTLSIEKGSFQKILLSKISSKEPLLLHILEYLIAASFRQSTHFDHLLTSIRKLCLTPQTTINILIFIHAYLQSGKNISENSLITLMNYLIFQCTHFIEFNYEAEGANPHKSMNEAKCKIMKTDTSTREDENCQSKEAFIFSLAKMYIRYLLKIVSIYDDFKRLSKMKSFQSYFAWMMINLLKCVSDFTSSFTIIGRYFRTQYGSLVISMIQILTKDVKLINESLRKYVIHQNHLLSCQKHLEENSEFQEFMKMMDEINNLNETLIQLYLGKYFYDDLQHLEQPAWINTNSSQFDTIFKIAGKRSKQVNNRQQSLLDRKKSKKQITAKHIK